MVTLKNLSDVFVPFGEFEHYFFKEIFCNLFRQVQHTLNNFSYALRVLGRVKPCNDP